MNTTTKYGLSIGILIGFFDACNFFLLYKTPFGMVSTFLIFVSIVGGIFLGIKNIKKNSVDQKITFGSGSLAGVTITFIAAVTFGLITYLFNQVKNEEFYNYISSETGRMMLESKKSPADIEKEITSIKSKTPFDQGKGAFLGTTIIGVVCSFLFGFILRNKYHDPSLPQSMR